MISHSPRRKPLDFHAIRNASLPVIPALVRRWLPHGRQLGREWIACNPRRTDRNPGSFKINLRSGCWADFATGEKGGDIISLAAYLFGLSQREAANRLAKLFSISREITQ